MPSDLISPESESAVRFSRFLHSRWAIALGISVTVGLGVFTLLGQIIQIAGDSTPAAYGLAAVIFIPLVLTYAERAAVKPDQGGAFSLIRVSDSLSLSFIGGWLSFGGYACLVALLGWGAALHLNLGIERLFGTIVDTRLLALVLVILVFLNKLFRTRETWRARTALVYGSIAVLLIIVIREWVSPGLTDKASLLIKPPDNILTVVALLAVNLWGIYLILDHGDQIHRPARTMLPILTISLVGGSALGGVAAVAVAEYPELVLNNLTPLASLAASMRGMVEVLYLVAGLLITLVALDRTLVSSLRLAGVMARDGFMSEQLLTIHPSLGTPIRSLMLFAIVAILVTSFIPFLMLVGIVALFALWVTTLVVGKDLFLPQSRLPKNRPYKSPFYPLFPAITLATCVFFTIGLSLAAWVIGLVWLALGGVYFAVYARRGGIAARRRGYVVGEIALVEREAEYLVLVGVANPVTAPSLINIGAKIARARGGRVLVVQVVVMPEQVPVHLKQEAAQREWQALSALVQHVEVEEVLIESMVRLAPSPEAGILETLHEERVDSVVLGWAGEGPIGEAEREPVVGPIVRAAPCEVVVMRGVLSGPIRSVIVPVAGGPHAPAALEVGESLVADGDGQVVALNIVRGKLTPEKEIQAQASLRQAVAETSHPESVEQRVVQANNIRDRILAESADFDLLLLGTTIEGLLALNVFGGLPAEVAQSRTKPTMLVKRFEGARYYWLRRLWQLLSDQLPTLTASERAEVYSQMRQSARADIDFYMLILLASVIAFMGLVQNSAAVIIGAMLVAPLMSPILAMAHSIVQGNLRMLRRAGESTVKGVALAIGVSIAVTVILPSQPATEEVLSRIHPNVLDLIVALASGAAAAYALSRRQLAAALPGVAIAAALVPPLGVVGYGLGSAQFQIANGALVLFATNLSAIILAAAIIFLLLGFRPARAERGYQMRRGIIVAILVLLAIAIPLGFTSVVSRRQIEREARVEALFYESAQEMYVFVKDFSIEAQDDGLVVNVTVYDFAEFDSDEVSDIQKSLSDAIGVPVTIRATVIDATLEEAVGEP